MQSIVPGKIPTEQEQPVHFAVSNTDLQSFIYINSLTYVLPHKKQIHQK